MEQSQVQLQETEVSIVTPMYNVGQYIAQTAEGVLGQSFGAWEWIVVDDGSIDNGAEIVEAYARKDARIKLIRQPNGGSAAARNRGIREAVGRYIALLDGDDVWHKNFLETQMRHIKTQGAGMVYSSYRRMDERMEREVLKPFVVPEKVGYEDILKTNPIFPSTVVYDTACVGKCYFDESLGSVRDDWACFLDMLKKTPYAYGTKEVLVDYRIRQGSATRKKYKLIGRQWKVLRHVEGLSVGKSAYCLAYWAAAGWKKYRK